MNQQPIQHFADTHPPLLALVTVERSEQILPVAEALSSGGITALEITLRTLAGVEAISLARREFPELCICAGTVTDSGQIDALAESGLNFLISPGLSEELVKYAQHLSLALLPGVLTPGEIMRGGNLGLELFKFFPAGVFGTEMLKALKGPFAGIQFCPTGGLSEDDFCSWLQLENVFACGGSWLVTPRDIDEGNWKTVTARAAAVRTRMQDHGIF